MPRASFFVFAVSLAVAAISWFGVPRSPANAQITFDQADVNSDGNTNSTDLLIVANGTSPTADVNASGVIDYADLQDLAAFIASRWSSGDDTVASPTAVPTPTITGWRGDYFANVDFRGDPALTRSDEVIDFAWMGKPDVTVPADYFSVRWSRTIDFAGGGYTFTVVHDDFARLSVDGRLVMQQWWMQAPTTYTTYLVLSPGPHTVSLEYATTYGIAAASLRIQADDMFSATGPGASPTAAAPPTATVTVVPKLTGTPTPPPASSTATSTATTTPTPSATATQTPTAVPVVTKSPIPPTLPPGLLTATPTPTAVPAPGTRDKYAWPFASTSIWNMPIGSGAVYVPAGIQNANAWQGRLTVDPEYIGLDPTAPLRVANGVTSVRVPAFMAADGSWNGVTALLTADNQRVAQGQPLVLTPGGDPSWQYSSPTVDIAGDGIEGAHGGSGLSSFGGSIRKGELSSPLPLHHALKVNLFGQRFLSYNGGACYRWPAKRCDSYASPSTYGGPITALRMGALLALPASVDLNALGLQSPYARKIAQAMQDYGAYVADDTAWDVHAIDLERGAEFSDGGTFDADLQRIFTMLAVVDNNGPTSAGGGGVPRVPLAPPIGN